MPNVQEAVVKWQHIAALAIGLLAVGIIIMGALHQLDQGDKDGLIGAAILASLFLVLTILAVFQ